MDDTRCEQLGHITNKECDSAQRSHGHMADTCDVYKVIFYLGVLGQDLLLEPAAETQFVCFLPSSSVSICYHYQCLQFEILWDALMWLVVLGMLCEMEHSNVYFFPWLHFL